MRIVVGICTYRRRSLLDTLESIAAQEIPSGATLEVIVADNDETAAQRDSIVAYCIDLGLSFTYVHAPARNISVARNACMDAARGSVLVFIDDDEIADPGWLIGLVTAWRESGAAVVFGPAHAIYPEVAPHWMRKNDFHSNTPVRRRGMVETGNTSNVLIDLGNPRVSNMRFDLAFGRTGGEDVDFFFRLNRAGAEMTIADDALVREKVVPNRLRFDWLVRRRFMTGAIYGTCVAPDDLLRRSTVFFCSMLKAAYCGLRALLVVPRLDRCTFWIMRSVFHFGVLSGCIKPPKREVYGLSAPVQN